MKIDRNFLTRKVFDNVKCAFAYSFYCHSDLYNLTNKIFLLITAWLNPTWERYSWKEGQVFYLTLTILRLVVTVRDVCLSVLTNKVNVITTWPLKETEIIRWASDSSKNSHVRWMVVRASRWISVFLWLILINEITAGPVKGAMSQS